MSKNQPMAQNKSNSENHGGLQTTAEVNSRNITQAENKADFERFINLSTHNHRFTKILENKANIRFKAVVKFKHCGRKHKMMVSNRANKYQKRQKRVILAQGNT